MTSKRSDSFSVLALLLTLGVAGMISCVNAAEEGAGGGAKLLPADQQFAIEVAQGSILEVQLGNMAREKGGSDEVKQFGEMMVADHAKANERLTAIASRRGLTLPSELDRKYQAVVDRFAKLSGDAFDKAYLEEMVKAHNKDVKEFQQASETLKDPDLKDFAEKTLPVLQKHLEHVKSLQNSKGKTNQ